MTRTIDVVAPQTMQEIFEQTQGDTISRMQQAPAILRRRGVSLTSSEAALQRMKALGELLYAHPELQKIYAERALVVACALCELIEPPMSLVAPDHATFDLEKFKQEASRAGL